MNSTCNKNVHYVLLIAVLLFFSFSTVALAASVDGQVTIGAGTNSDQNYHTQEYKADTNDNMIGSVAGEVNYRNANIDSGLSGVYTNGDDQAYSGELDVSRIFNIKADYRKFMHYLDQDGLLHLQGTSAGPGMGAQLWHSYEYAPELSGDTNEVPDQDFGITNEDIFIRTVLRVPVVPMLKVGMDFRRNDRNGCQQTMGMSKCGSCHIVAHKKSIDEVTTDLEPFVQGQIGNLSLQYKFLYREVDISGGADHKYDVARHPFMNPANYMKGALLYHEDNGAIPISKTPELVKTSHTVKGKYGFNSNHASAFSYIHSTVTNTSSDDLGYVDSNLEMNYDAGSVSYTGKLSDNLLLTTKARYQTIDNDDAEIRLNKDHEYTRESAYDRNILNGKVALRYRVLPKLTLLTGYEYQNEERDNGDDFLAETGIDTHEITVKAKWRAYRNLKASLGYKFTYVNSPYTYKDAAYPTHCDLGVDDNGMYDTATGAAAYTYGKYVYGARTHDMSASPETEHEVKARVNWSPFSNVFVSAYSKYVHAENDQGMHYTYVSDLFDSGIDVTVSPITNLSMTFGYNNYYHSTDSQFYIPYYHG